MASSVVLDASALLALLFGEAGSDVVLQHLPDSLISAVNFAEVLSKTIDRGMPLEEAIEVLASLPCEVVAFDGETATLAAGLRATTRSHGLSLGDRACLALGMKAGVPVVTADRKWSACGLDLAIVLIR